MLALVPVLLALAPVASSLPGIYRSQQIEVAAALELTEDGRFRYALDYGAVSEETEGKWTSDGKTVRLTSAPMPKPPGFEIVRDDPAPPGELWVQFENPGFEWGGPLEMLVTVEGLTTLVRTAPDDHGRVDIGQGRVLAIQPLIPVYEEFGPPLKLAGGRGHRLTIRFLRNDLGKARFSNQPLAIDGDGLLLKRYDASIRLRRVGPPLKRPGE
ncbi:MAG: hypothetical protein ABIS39_01430 [Sphingomicrobium sp.]